MKKVEFNVRLLSLIVNSACTALLTLFIANNVDLITFSILSYCLASSYSLSSILKSRYIIHQFRNKPNTNHYEYFQIIRQRCIIYLISFFIFQFCVLTYFEIQTIDKLIWCFFCINVMIFDLYLNALSFSNKSKISLAINSFNLISIFVFVIFQQNVTYISHKLVTVIFWMLILSLFNSFFYLASKFTYQIVESSNTTRSSLTTEPIINQSIYTIFVLGLMSISQDSYGLVRISYMFISSLPLLFLTAYSQNIIKKYSSIPTSKVFIARDTGRLLCVVFVNIILLTTCENLINDYFKYNLQDIYKYALGSIFYLFSALYQQISFFIADKKANLKNFITFRVLIYLVSYILPLSIISNYGFDYYNLASFIGLCCNIVFLGFILKRGIDG